MFKNKHIGTYSAVIMFSFFSIAIPSFASSNVTHKIQDIGGGLSLITVLPVFETVRDETSCPKFPKEEWVEVPAVYETYMDTEVAQYAYRTLDVTPPEYDGAGRLKNLAKAEWKDIPAVTREVPRHRVKTPATVKKRVIPSVCKTVTKRVMKSPTVYLIKTDLGIIIQSYSDQEDLADFLNSRIKTDEPQDNEMQIGQDLGGGLNLITIPKTYETVQQPHPSCMRQQETEWVKIPAVYEIITESYTSSPAQTDISVLPPVYEKDGKLKMAARAKLTTTPAVIKNIERNILKAKPKLVQRIIPTICGMQTIRLVKFPEFYIVITSDGDIAEMFHDAEALGKFLNAR
ncbi:MAG: hypothetical protein ACPGVT_09575 [Maricaulaceae bacterium]